ncbi:MAG: T9SS type A sorting domain-containing protein [Candidatus Marinimicrobia bacterium]|nr:T9SS type A sorting domain-containing protein [Candidatus Neomarinimicrobiota bacterium]MBT3632260.1 T9SS type A sorting domain-containing protein [Candidatus Neomarinimicrobiota bacterium]MBT3825932.1 T9SS type A sorting domain-containing protein [Candidatus Neomarinimicrobiota bacterium]MBT4129662.1 T9SS type A sorting domain-containing protein [Candidatus Neomarinimicrobiota bacterium]MBT4294443.1 T9SS type A sorting domain-containing protein [Candidatus Neomarinimicrobiota bacterium]
MKRFSALLSILLMSTSIAQVYEDTNMPCKPISEMAAHYNYLAKASQRADIFDFDVHYYNIELDINIDTEIIYGNVEIHIISEVDNLESIQLDFTSGMTVDAVTLNGANFNHFSDLLSITLDGSYNVDESLVVGIQYHGHPLQGGFQAFAFGHQNNDPARPPMISTLSEPYGARSWWPCKDVPTDKADSVRISVTTDAAYDAVANGLLIAENDNFDGTKTTVWKHKYPITTYLVSIAITDYTYWTEMHHFADGDSMPLEYWMYPASATADIVDRWNRTADMIDIFGEYFGKYPFAEEKYGMAQFQWGGAMEHQTCSSMGSYGENTIAHELAHQWWGNLVTCSNFHHIWINEGFATYSEALYWGAKNGDAAYHAHMALKNNDAGGSVYRPDTSTVGNIFSWNHVYQKGAWVLHMLRHVIQDEAFFNSFLEFREMFQYSHASTEDFQGVAESQYGESLEWFFDQWIYGSGKPHYRWWWHSEVAHESGLNKVTIQIDQIQNSEYPIFKMPIDIKISGVDKDTTIIVWDLLRVQEFRFDLDFEPLAVYLDDESWIFKSATQVAGDGEHDLLPGDFRLLAAYPNPFNSLVTIPFTIDSRFEGDLSIFNLKGELVHSQSIIENQSGYYELLWNGLRAQGSSLSSGIYIVQLRSSDKTQQSQKITLLK